jgi:hypothetical protein
MKWPYCLRVLALLACDKPVLTAQRPYPVA